MVSIKFPLNDIYHKCPVYLIFWIINCATSTLILEIRYKYCKLIANIAHASMHSFLKSNSPVTEREYVTSGGTNWGYDPTETAEQNKWEGIFGKNKLSELGDGLRPIRMCGGDTIDKVFSDDTKLLNFKQTKEFWDEIMKKCLPNIISGDLSGFSIGTYGQFDIYIKMNCLTVVWYMFRNVLKVTKNLSYLNDWTDSLLFITSDYTKPIRFIDAKNLQKIRSKGIGLNTIGSVYTNFELLTYWLDLSNINWDKLNQNTITSRQLNEENKYTNIDPAGHSTTSKSLKNKTVFLQATNAKTGVSGEVSDIITNFSKNVSDPSFVDKYINNNTPIGLMYKCFGKDIEGISDILNDIGARDPDSPNKYKFECMFQFNLFSFPHNLIMSLMNTDVVFPTGATGDLYTSMNCITNMNYLKDFDPKNPLITPGYTNDPITIVKVTTPTWTGLDKPVTLNYPIRYYTRNFYLNTKEMGEHMIKYQGNLYQNKGWTFDVVIDNIKKDVYKSRRTNIKYFTKNGQMEHVVDQENSASEEVLNILITLSGVEESTNDKVRERIVGEIIAGTIKNIRTKDFRGWTQYFSTKRTNFTDPETGANISTGPNTIRDDFLGKFNSIIKMDKWKKWGRARQARREQERELKEQQSQKNNGLEDQNPQENSPSSRELPEEEEINNTGKSFEDPEAEVNAEGTTKVSGRGSNSNDPRSLSESKPPDVNATKPDGTPLETEVNPGPSKAAVAEAKEAGAFAGTRLEAIGLGIETFFSVLGAAADVYMAVMMVISIVAETGRMWDDLCQHADTYFQAQLGAKEFAIDMYNLQKFDDGTGGCEPNTNYVPADPIINPPLSDLEKLILQQDTGTNCLQCGVDNTATPNCPSDTSPNFSKKGPQGEVCSDPYKNGTDEKGILPCSYCQPGGSGEFNCVPDDLCIPDKNGVVLFPCRCNIFQRLSTNRDALVKKEMSNNIIVNANIQTIKERNKKFTTILVVIVILVIISLVTKYIFAPKQTTM